VGDSTREMVFGGRNGLLSCLSGGYDTSTVSIPTLQDPSQQHLVTVFPNPVNDQMNIRVNLDQQAFIKLELYDFSGRYICLIQQGIFSSGEQTFVWSRQIVYGNRLQPGMFYLKATIGNQIQWLKVVAE